MGSGGFRALKVADLMSAPVTLPALSNVRDAAIFLAQAGVPIAPIVSPRGVYAGAFGEADVHRRLSEGTRGFHTAEEFRTGVPFLGSRLPDMMWAEFARVAYTPVHTLAQRVPAVAPRDRVVDAADAMRRKGLSAVPVVDDDRPVGILYADALTIRLLEFALAAGG